MPKSLCNHVCWHRRVSASLVSSMGSRPGYNFDHRNYISYTNMHQCLKYIHNILCQYYLFLSKDSHFKYFLYLPLQPAWLNTELSYLAQPAVTYHQCNCTYDRNCKMSSGPRGPIFICIMPNKLRSTWTFFLATTGIYNKENTVQ